MTVDGHQQEAHFASKSPLCHISKLLQSYINIVIVQNIIIQTLLLQTASQKCLFSKTSKIVRTCFWSFLKKVLETANSALKANAFVSIIWDSIKF